METFVTDAFVVAGDNVVVFCSEPDVVVTVTVVWLFAPEPEVVVTTDVVVLSPLISNVVVSSVPSVTVV